MFESALRANAARLQLVYDAMPYTVQNLLASTRGLFLARYRYSQENGAYLRELRSHESWTAEQISEYQLQGLNRLLEHARRNVPFYADYSVGPIRRLEDFRKYPVLTRETVRSNAGKFVSRLAGEDCIRVGTTGTTGASLGVAYSESVARRNWAFHMRRWAWAGVRPRTPRITFFGSRVVPIDRKVPPFWTRNLSERQTLASIFHLSESNAPDYIQFLRHNTGMVLEGFPSVLAILADFIRKTKSPIPMRVVFTDGEPLYPRLRETIEEAFSARVFDLYGNTELCGLIHQCEAGRMHAAPDYAFLEILDENNLPVRTGDEGYFVWTGFVNDTMPLVRYRIGDRGCRAQTDSCDCGRAFPVVVPTITRDSDQLHCPDGRIFSPRALNQALKGARALRFCQILHEQPGHVVIRGVASDAGAYDDVMMIRANLQKILGPTISVSAMLADNPIIRAGGKIPLIVQSPAKHTAESAVA
jgi:phenylacetate-coenzyme A ligase PaaK-like adenylate-forming protein